MQTIKVNGVDIAFVEQGEGPLVLLCHGWPELSYSWRRQMPALAAAGFRVVAPDMRGYGESGKPSAVDAYTIMDLTGDMVALVAALGARQAVVVGHDWGAHVAWHCALFRPDVFPAVAALSVPFGKRAPARPLDILTAKGLTTFYWQYFQKPGVAEAEFARDWSHAIRAVLYGSGLTLLLKPGRGMVEDAHVPPSPPAWISESELQHYIDVFSRTGLAGGFNWYRNIDRNWELTAPWQGAKIRQPALFIAGTRDSVVMGDMGAARLREMDEMVPGLQRKLMIEGAGHWIQQERPDEVNAALIDFLRAN
ncbi:MAG: alpha/beta hydrolase [Hyphomicrobiales bacterium]|nr:alpha/beta hydrolase [Hyphomicrobiales bacterium]